MVGGKLGDIVGVGDGNEVVGENDGDEIVGLKVGDAEGVVEGKGVGEWLGDVVGL